MIRKIPASRIFGFLYLAGDVYLALTKGLGHAFLDMASGIFFLAAGVGTIAFSDHSGVRAKRAFGILSLIGNLFFFAHGVVHQESFLRLFFPVLWSIASVFLMVRNDGNKAHTGFMILLVTDLILIPDRLWHGDVDEMIALCLWTMGNLYALSSEKKKNKL